MAGIPSDTIDDTQAGSPCQWGCRSQILRLLLKCNDPAFASFSLRSGRFGAWFNPSGEPGTGFLIPIMRNGSELVTAPAVIARVDGNGGLQGLEEGDEDAIARFLEAEMGGIRETFRRKGLKGAQVKPDGGPDGGKGGMLQ